MALVPVTVQQPLLPRLCAEQLQQVKGGKVVLQTNGVTAKQAVVGVLTVVQDLKNPVNA